MQPEQDVYGMGMACYDDSNWQTEQQRQDDEAEQRQVTEAYQRIYLAINRLELLDNCSYTDLRADVRFTEEVMFRK